MHVEFTSGFVLFQSPCTFYCSAELSLTLIWQNLFCSGRGVVRFIIEFLLVSELILHMHGLFWNRLLCTVWQTGLLLSGMQKLSDLLSVL